MSTTFHHPEHNIPITLPAGLTQDQVLRFQPFQSWLQTLTHSLTTQSSPAHPFHANPYALRSITIQSHDLFGPTRIGFLKLTCSVTNTSSSPAPAEWLSGAVFLRGPSVAMLVMLTPDDDPTERHVLLTVQPRIAAGSLAFVELPAGMVDNASQTFAGTAAREIKEELGLEIAVGELVCLTDLAAQEGDAGGEEGLPRGMYPSPGACDEYIGLYACERRVPRAQLGEWSGRLTGLREEGEKITLRLVRMEEVWKVAGRDGKTLAALALWEGLKREGRV